MMLMPIYMFPTSVTCLYCKWHTKQRSLPHRILSLMEKSGNVILSSKGEIHNADIVVTYNDGTVLKLYSYSSVDSPMVVFIKRMKFHKRDAMWRFRREISNVLYQVDRRLSEWKYVSCHVKNIKKMKLRYMKYVSLASGLCFLLSMFSSCCLLADALESAGENRAEMQRVLEHFNNDW